MEKTSVQKLAAALRVLVVIAFVCNLIALLLVPGMALMKGPEGLSELTPYENPFELPLRLAITFLFSWGWVWSAGSYEIVLTLFLLVCGVCTALILWQAKRILNAMLRGEVFTVDNARSMKRASFCSLVIAAAALIRLVWGLIHYGSMGPLLTYNALFVPVFAMGFLLFQVMSALFRQAAEMKAEQDLTI